MFYAHFVLSKKGPLARIWLAAHWDKKLTKAHVFETNIESSVEGILQPKVKMALRTSGHLLLGVVRIYSRKAKYLLADCNEAFIKIKMAFRPGVVDLPEESREAALNAITLPEVFHDFDSAMPELNDVDMQPQYTLNQSRAEEITMREEYGNITLVGDDGFGDMGFEDNEIVRDGMSIDESLDHTNLLFGNEKKNKEDRNRSGSSHVDLDKHNMTSMDIDAPLHDDGFGGDVGGGFAADAGGLFEPGGLFDETPMEHVPSMDITNNDKSAKPAPLKEKNANESDDDDDDDYYGDMGPPSVGAPSSGRSSPLSPVPVKMNIDDLNEDQPPVTNNMQPALDQTTLVHNEEEAFALAPLETTVFQGIERGKGKRKRKLIIDDVKNISGEEMKSQLADTADIVTTLDLAPPTKRLMHWKETGGVEKLFALPGRPIHSKCLSKLFQRHLTTRAVENENIGLLRTEEDRTEQESNKEDHMTQVAQGSHKLHASLALEEPIIDTRHSNEKHLDLSRVLPEENLLDLPNDSHQLLLDTSLEPVQQVPQPPKPISPILPQPSQPSPLHSPHLQLQQTMSNLQDSEKFVNTDLQSRKQQQHASIALEDPFESLTQLDHHQPSVSHSEMLQTHDDFFSQSAVTSNMHQSIDRIQPPLTPFHDEEEDDFGCPVSVGPPEEQGADETYEQYEERILNKRAQQMLYIVKRHLNKGTEQGQSQTQFVKFSDLARHNTRKQVAQKFYTLLVLKKQQAVELEQKEAFGELYVFQGPNLNMY